MMFTDWSRICIGSFSLMTYYDHNTIISYIVLLFFCKGLGHFFTELNGTPETRDARYPKIKNNYTPIFIFIQE